MLDESDESELWLTVADDRKFGLESERTWLIQEAGELRAVFSKGYQTARQRERGPH